MYRPARIIDSHIHLLTAGTHEAKQKHLAALDPALFKAYRQRWEDSLASRKEEGPEPRPADVLTVAGKWSAELDRAGIERAVFFTSPDMHDDLFRFAALNPHRFTAYTTLNPTLKGNDGVLRKQIEQDNIKGLKLYPMAKRFHVDDGDCYPVYRICQEYNIPILIHFGISINATHDLKFGNPLDLSGPALSFPGVNWIIPHFGTGFFRETLLMAAQYPNIYIDTSSSNNWIQHMPYSLTLKELFARALDTVGSQRMLFGTDSSFFPRGYRSNILEEQLAACHELNISKVAVDDIFYDNIKRILEGAQSKSLMVSMR